MKERQPLLSACFLAITGSTVMLAPSMAAQSVDTAQNAVAVLEKRCISCHGAAMQAGGLRLDSRAGALKGGKSGAVLLPGKAGASRLYRLVAGLDDKLRMPPGGESLSAAEIASIKTWIDGGVAGNRGLSPKPAH